MLLVWLPVIVVERLCFPWIRSWFSDDETYNKIRTWLKEPQSWLRYKGLLDASLGLAYRFFGRDWSWPAFSRCLSLAFLYPVVLLLGSWIGGATAVVADVPLLETQSLAWLERLGLACLIAVLLVIVFTTIWQHERLGTWLFEKVFLRFNLWRCVKISIQKSPLAIAYGVAMLGGYMFAVVGATAVAGAIYIISSVGFAVAIFRPSAVSSTGKFALTVAISAIATSLVVGGGTIAYPETFSGIVEPLVALLILYLVLPIVNACADWLSWIVTRRLLVRLGQKHGGGAFIFHAGIDILSAIGFLAVLAFLLPLIVEFANVLFAAIAWPPLEWRPMLDAARVDPFGAGIMVTGMLLTTLIPTAFHLGLALGAVLLPRLDVKQPLYPFHKHLTACVWNEDQSPDYIERSHVAFWLFGNFAVALALLLFFIAMLYALISTFSITFGQILLDLANFGASLAGG